MNALTGFLPSTYRKQRGVNLGSLYTLETWLTPSLFNDVRDAKSEHDLCSKLDAKAAKERLERHWNAFIDAGDWQWMKQNGINTVRLPISYYHFLPGHPSANVRELMRDTEYSPFTSIYEAAYGCILRTIESAAAHDIGVLIDLHAAPGGQNGEGHSGLSTGKADFFQKSKNRKTTVSILLAIADVAARYDNVVGLELLNEPHNSDKLPCWYAEAIHAICSRYGTRLPLYLGDCWSTEQYVKLLKQNQHHGFLVMDHHLYRCFTPQDHGKSAQQHASEVHPASQGPSYGLISKASSDLQGSFVIGEWSAALHHTSLQGLPSSQEGQRQWAHAQLEAFHAQCGGFFFWTLKKEGPPDAGWCLYSAVEQGVLPKGLGGPKTNKPAEELEQIGQHSGNEAFEGHVNYWNAHANGTPMHHDRFLAGFRQMWTDCLAFYQRNASEVGFGGRWIEQRAKANSRQHGADGEWEFVHGAQQALRAFNHAIRA